jgi:hypothetical protein
VASVVQHGAALAAGILTGDLIVRALRRSRQLLPALDEAAVEATRREKGLLRLRYSQDATPRVVPLRRPARPEAAGTHRSGPRARSSSFVSTTRAVAKSGVSLCCSLFSFCSKPTCAGYLAHPFLENDEFFERMCQVASTDISASHLPIEIKWEQCNRREKPPIVHAQDQSNWRQLVGWNRKSKKCNAQRAVR